MSFVTKIANYIRNKEERKTMDRNKKKFPTSIVKPHACTNNTSLEGDNVIFEYANVAESTIGYATIVGFNSKLYNAKVGKFCSISWDVRVSDSTHPLDLISTYPGFYNTRNNYPFGKGRADKEELLRTDNGYSVEIGNDVWIGESVILRGGIKIGDGAVIGMGAVVTKDVPPYAIVGGVPAKVIKYRFNGQQIEQLLKIKWWDWPIDLIKQRKELFKNTELFLEKFN